MAGRATTKKTIKANTVRDMKMLGVYKEEYDPIIDIYAELREQYEIITAEFVRGGYQYETDTNSGGAKKAPIVATLEGLRKDILSYSDRLCLNPKAIENISTAEKGQKKSKLEAFLTEMSK